MHNGLHVLIRQESENELFIFDVQQLAQLVLQMHCSLLLSPMKFEVYLVSLVPVVIKKVVKSYFAQTRLRHRY
jgi:hypothetical protein